MSNEHDHDHDDEHECGADDLPMAMELETASQVLLEMRSQNLELIKVAAQVAGYTGNHGPLKPSELRQAVNAIWDVYSQLYQWIDPEDSEAADDDEDEEDDD